MIPIKFRISYVFRSDGLARVRVAWNGIRMFFSLGYRVDRVDAKGRPKWDGNRCRMNTTHGSDKVPAAVINRAIDAIESKIINAFADFESKDIIPTKDQLKEAVNGKPKEPGSEFFDAFDKFIDYGRSVSQWSASTIRKLATIKKLLLLFRPDLRFDDVTPELINQFMAFQTSNAVEPLNMREVEKGKEIIKYKGRYQNDTINRNVRCLKWFMKWAHSQGLHNNLSYENHSLRYKTTHRPVIFLTWEELMRMLSLDLSLRPELEKTRDMFCFCCFTSLRYSDMANLTWADVSEDHISVTTVKTTDSLTIDLNKYSRAILDKYRSDGNPSGSVFSSKSSQKMNDGLKVIGKLCHIDTPVHLVEVYGSERKNITVPKYELLSTHCGRRTFICNALALGIPPNVVMKWTGHSDYKAMQPYIEIADSVRRASMRAFDNQ